ncbi:FecR family protein [Steroidobacter sp.]|uniref:FecR family protein n=1 Tax=Steroidobacter sp. TaxID=1978227 RepID=UPI001A484ADD|nr:FecR family protein [Steroidobacter sp.]MBL8270123.1 FecR family protein [Steroidobacter sp.]
MNSAAAEWLAKLQHGELSSADQAEFDRWMDANPAHAVAFARAEQAWEQAKRLQALPKTNVSATKSAARPHWAIAASVLVAVLGFAFWYFVWESRSYSTDVGERRSVMLKDGSQINLNTASRVEIDMSEQQRTVRLVRGEGLFKVAHDPTRPFVVMAGNTAVRAVGTAFNVRMRGEQLVEVTVTEGIVSVGDRRISADSTAVVAAGAVSSATLEKDELHRRVAWREGVIELKGETLAQAVDEFNRYSKRKLVVADPAIAAIRVGGRFETDEADKFLNAITTSFAIRVVAAENDQVFLLGRP